MSDFPFAYDHIFQAEASQVDLYDTVAQPIVEGVINGFNGAIIAYGQTGSGKTHTMWGRAESQGCLAGSDRTELKPSWKTRPSRSV